MRKIYFTVILGLLMITAWSQNGKILETTKNHLKIESSNLGLTPSDLQELTIETNYTDEKSQIEYAYVQQNLAGYPIYGAIANFALKNDEVIYLKENFQKNIHQRIGNQALNNDLNHIAALAANKLRFELDENAFLNTSFNNRIEYYSNENGLLDLSWVVYLNVIQDNELKTLELVVHAETAEIFKSYNQLLSCGFEPGTFSNPITPKKQSENIKWLRNQYAINTPNDGAKYRVYKLPTESPLHGERSLITNLADPEASPFGWHDIDGQPGADYTDTRGNNVSAIKDHLSEAFYWVFWPSDYVLNGFIEGGEDLNFDFPLNFNRSLYGSSEAAITNLFYMNNVLHDTWYQYGFTEAAGNFQVNNYGKGGIGNDPVLAIGQTGQNLGAMNNAYFGVPPDGKSSYMLMMMWGSDEKDNHLLSINTPGPFEGNYDGIGANFGPKIVVPITGDLVIPKHNAQGDPYNACFNLSNKPEINGKIAIVYNKDCPYIDKVLRLQTAGAIGVVVVQNSDSEPFKMTGSNPDIVIPAIMISKSDGNLLFNELLNGGTLNASIPKEGHLDGFRDSSIDNSIIAHEYGHGISIRLAGGPQTSSCLTNNQQMGEGWSDFIALAMTMYPGDQGEDPRGLGDYVLSEPPGGMRPTPYSTDMSINPSTYNTIQHVIAPHGVGYVWATMLWEVIWELIDEYGFDPDIYNGTGGNNLAMQLIIDGLKLQTCHPGFADARDAILEADEINNEGVNQCRIWRAFAKRGLGYSAIQAHPEMVFGGTEAFDMPPKEIIDCQSLMETEDLLNTELSLYPNPARDEVYILTDKAYGQTEIYVQDLTGRTVLNTKVDLSNQRATIDVNSLSTGVYVLVINTEDGKITKKLIKK